MYHDNICLFFPLIVSRSSIVYIFINNLLPISRFRIRNQAAKADKDAAKVHGGTILTVKPSVSALLK